MARYQTLRRIGVALLLPVLLFAGLGLGYARFRCADQKTRPTCCCPVVETERPQPTLASRCCNFERVDVAQTPSTRGDSDGARRLSEPLPVLVPPPPPLLAPSAVARLVDDTPLPDSGPPLLLRKQSFLL